MSRAPPFIFGAGAGQAAPAFPSPHQNDGKTNNTPPSFSNSTSAPPPPPPSTQQPAFQQNGQLPGIDMSALAGVSPDQVALIAHLLRTGALPPPPPPPVPPARQQASASVAPADLRQSHQDNKQQENSDMGREEGEVEEGEAGNNTPPQSTLQGSSRAPPTGPRNASTSRRSSQCDLSQSQNGSSPQSRRASNLSARPTNGMSTAHVRAKPSKEHQAKQLVLTMHQAGFSYEDLARTPGVDPRPLRRMFQQLGLPMSSRPDLSNGGQSASGSSLDHDSFRPIHASTSEVSQKPSPLTKASAPGKLDRSAYLAKLQAAKAGKAGPTSAHPAAAPAVQEQPVRESSTSAKLQQSAAASGTSSTAPLSSKAVKTELARQRLEAFKAEQAAKQQNKSLLATTQPSSSPVHTSAKSAPAGVPSPAAASQNSLGVGLDKVPTVAGDRTSPLAIPDANQRPQTLQQSMSPVPATPGSAFGGLPGLFMNVAPQQTSPQPTATPTRTLSQSIDRLAASTQQSNVAGKRVADIASDRMAPRAKRPFGQSRSASEDESFIIENSDDEDDGLPMNVDAKIENIRTSLQPGTQQPSVPGASKTQAETLEQKLKAIEDLNHKIAEKKARAKAQANLQASAIPESDAVNGTTSSGIPGISVSTLPSATLEGQALAQNGPTTPQEKSLKKQKEELLQRIAELEKARKESSLHAGAGADSTPASIVQAFEPPTNVESSIEAVKKTTQADEANNTAALEDDDGASESDFDFYGNEEAIETEMPTESSKQDDLQASVTTAEADPVADTGSPSSSPLAHSQESQSASEDVNVVEDGAFQESGRQDTEMSVHDRSGLASEAGDVNNEVSGLVEAQTQGSEADVEMESDSSDSDDSSDEDLGGFDEPTHAANVEDPKMSSMDGVMSSDAEEEESGSSSPGSADSEEYDPESDVRFEGRSADATASQPAMPADDDLAPELQPALEQALAETTDQSTSNEPKHKYQPYESVLRMFKDYRFHPQYLETVSEGYRSLSYNHQIDIKKELCDIETSEARVCDRRDCPFQHFDDMKISDNVLLQQMGTKNIPTRSKDGIQRWNAGLQQLIQSLKAANIRDANDIATRIAQYRRDFVRDELGDPSKIVYPTEEW